MPTAGGLQGRQSEGKEEKGRSGSEREERNWLYEWSPRRKTLNRSPSHTLKPEKALLEIPVDLIVGVQGQAQGS